MSEYYFKLTEKELFALANQELITKDDTEAIKTRSLAREPRKFDKQPIRKWLNKAETIDLRSIHFYGGEHFGEPYYFVAEILNFTTNSAFRRFMNKWEIPIRVFTY